MKKFILLLFIVALAACNKTERSTTELASAVEETQSTITVPAEPETTEPAPTIPEQNSKYLITDKGVDIFIVGDNIPIEADGYKITKKIEIDPRYLDEYDVYTVSENGETMLRIENYRKPMIADQIYVLSNKLKTSQNIGLGSTIEEFTVAYPDYELWFFCVSDVYISGCEEGAYGLSTAQLQNVQFYIGEDDFLSKEKLNDVPWQIDRLMLEPTDFKKGTTIKQVRIY